MSSAAVVIAPLKVKELNSQNATNQVLRQSAHWFWRRRYFKVFTIYEHGGHLGNGTQTKYINSLSLFAWRLHMKLNSNGQEVSEEKTFENYRKHINDLREGQ